MYLNRNKELEVISLFRGDYNARFYLREISKLSKLPLKTCQNALMNLEKSKILKSKLEGKNKYFSLNLENIKTKLCLQQAEIYQTDLFIEKYSLHDIFSVIVTGNDVSQGKPHPDVYLRAAEKLKALPEECLVLEDATHGVVAAKDAGMICVAIRNPFVKNPLDLSLADCIVNSLSEITEEFIRRIL